MWQCIKCGQNNDDRVNTLRKEAFIHQPFILPVIYEKPGGVNAVRAGGRVYVPAVAAGFQHAAGAVLALEQIITSVLPGIGNLPNDFPVPPPGEIQRFIHRAVGGFPALGH